MFCWSTVKCGPQMVLPYSIIVLIKDLQLKSNKHVVVSEVKTFMDNIASMQLVLEMTDAVAIATSEI